MKDQRYEVHFHQDRPAEHIAHVKLYLEGYLQALQDYGIWKNGERYIGALEHNIYEAFARKAYDLDEVERVVLK